MAILRAVEATPDERAAYLKHAIAVRAAANAGENGEPDEAGPADDEEERDVADVSLSLERIAELGAAEQFILTVSSEGYGKRTSAYDYRRAGRGGRGLIAHDLTRRGGRLVASFPVEETDEILLVSDQGQLIRVPVDQIRFTARNSTGVVIFRKAEDEHVVSVERIEGDGAPEDGAPEDGAPEDGAAEEDDAADENGEAGES